MKIESVVVGINGLFVADYWMVFIFLFFLQTLPTIEWGRHIWAILDVGCGVASFGVYLLDKNVLTMSFAPKDEHEAEIQFDLEGGSACYSVCHWNMKADLSGQSIWFDSLCTLRGSLGCKWYFMQLLFTIKSGVLNFFIPIDVQNTLSIIPDRGLIGIYHDWCKSLEISHTSELACCPFNQWLLLAHNWWILFIYLIYEWN